MKKSELVQKSVYLVTEYYRGNLQPFFGSLADEVLWFGPRGGQVLEGRENLIATWAAAGDPGLVFTMGDVQAKAVSTGTNGLEVLLEYYVRTHFPDGSADEHRQRLHFSWGVKREGGNRVPRVFMIHISNVVDDADTASPGSGGTVKVYADSAVDSRVDAVRSAGSFPRVRFRTMSGKGSNGTTCFFGADSIIWVESADGGRHAVVHTLEGSYRSMERLAYFQETAGGMLVRVHASYLANPMYVRSVTRFSLTLADGTVLPVPQKKYTQVKRALEEWRMPG